MNFSADQGQVQGGGYVQLQESMYNAYEATLTPPQSKEVEESFIDENDDNIPYTKKRRVFGDGEIRIGTYLSLNDDIYSLGFACLVKNELVDEVILKESASRPQEQYAPVKTPKGSLMMPDKEQLFNQDNLEEEIYEDEKKQIEWEQKMMKLYEERQVGRTNILIHVVITAFC